MSFHKLVRFIDNTDLINQFIFEIIQIIFGKILGTGVRKEFLARNQRPVRRNHVNLAFSKIDT